ncbi:hypothetical protein POM88_035839 [Heracleum sosnowskyi]|uniref:Uncharacterized protein n=1 Tax=Heracleum sosnowskyi TaxID=360622 RepID=A0AAD8HP25_9APIA|nr:hypothetical protein POM88_035839 [Heracleum sosnowskyi]
MVSEKDFEDVKNEALCLEIMKEMGLQDKLHILELTEWSFLVTFGSKEEMQAFDMELLSAWFKKWDNIDPLTFTIRRRALVECRGQRVENPTQDNVASLEVGSKFSDKLDGFSKGIGSSSNHSTRNEISDSDREEGTQPILLNEKSVHDSLDAHLGSSQPTLCKLLKNSGIKGVGRPRKRKMTRKTNPFDLGNYSSGDNANILALEDEFDNLKLIRDKMLFQKRLSTPSEIKTAFYDHFKEFFSGKRYQGLFISAREIIPQLLSLEYKEFLDRGIFLEELDLALMQSVGNKAPSPDGLTLEVLKQFWPNIRLQVLENAKVFFREGTLPIGINSFPRRSVHL